MAILVQSHIQDYLHKEQDIKTYKFRKYVNVFE